MTDLQDLSRSIQSRTAAGLQVILLPESHRGSDDSVVQPLLASLREDPNTLLVIAEPDTFSPFRSLGSALLAAFNQKQTGRGRVFSILGKAVGLAASVAEGLSQTATIGALAGKGISKMVETPLTALQKRALDPASIRDALVYLRSKSKVVVYLKRAWGDHAETLRLLAHQLPAWLNDLPVDRPERDLLFLLCLDKKTAAGDVGDQCRSSAEDFSTLHLITAGADQTETESVAEDLAKALASSLPLFHAASVVRLLDDCGFAGPYSESLLDSALGNQSDSLGLLARYGLLIQEDGYWIRSESVDPYDLEIALEEAELEGLEETDTIETAGRLHDALEGKTQAEILVGLATRAERPGSVLLLVMSELEQAFDEEGAQGIAYQAQALADLVSGVDFAPNGVADSGAKEAERAKEGAELCLKIEGALRTLAWSVAHAEFAQLLDLLLPHVEELLEEDLHTRARKAVDAHLAYLLLLTDRGRVKLVEASTQGIRRAKRNTSAGEAVVFRPQREGRLSEAVAVCRGDLLWAFCSDSTAVALPVAEIDAYYRRIEEGGIFQDIGPLLGLRQVWAQPGRVLAITPAAPGAQAILLLTDSGLALALRPSDLPVAPGSRIAMESSVIAGPGLLRWAIPFRSSEDLLVASSGNRVLRLHSSDVVAHVGDGPFQIIQLVEDETVSATATAPVRPEVNSMFFLATTGGYGGQVMTQALPYGQVGGPGTPAQKEGKRSGSLCTVESVTQGGDVFLMTHAGRVVRLRLSDINVRQPNRVGWKLLQLSGEDEVCGGCTL